MSRSTEQKKPISPQDLFQKLLAGNYKQIECVDEASKLRQQREIILNLLSEYRIEIKRRMDEFDQLEALVLMRNKLRVELEGLRNQRISIDRNIQYQIQRNKLNGEEVADHNRIKIEIEELIQKNMGLEARLRELNQYCYRLETKNAKLQKQNMIVEEHTLRVRSNSDLGDCGSGCAYGGWRQRINARRIDEQRMNMDLQHKIRRKQEQNRNYIRIKEAEIAEGNRRRMQSFKERFRRQF